MVNTKMAGTVSFMGEQCVLMRLKVEEGGQFKGLGRTLAFFLYDTEDASKNSVGEAAVNFCATLPRDYASATTQGPVKTNNSNVEYIVSYEDGWKITVRASKSHSVDVQGFLELCKADINKRPSSSNKQPRVARKRSPSGYHIFGHHVRDMMKKEQQEFNPKNAMSEIGKRWRDLSDDEKEEWNKKAKVLPPSE